VRQRPRRPWNVTDIRRFKQRRRLSALRRPALVLGLAALCGVALGGATSFDPVVLKPGYGDIVYGCKVTDGDTLRCRGERIRLLAIDAPEMPGHCRPGRLCVPGDPYASGRSLSTALSGKMKIARYGEDDYGRTLAAVTGPKGDLSCYQLRTGNARYRSAWDDDARIARTCPTAII
jgi:micrococcal nuclease